MVRAACSARSAARERLTPRVISTSIWLSVSAVACERTQREHRLQPCYAATGDFAAAVHAAQRRAAPGQIVEVATAAEFFRAPKHPYARLLLEALPDTTKRGETLAAIAGTVPPLSQPFALLLR